MTKYIIVAPHADDEIIGCYELLASDLVARVLFPNDKELTEANASSEHFLFGRQLIEDHDFYNCQYLYLFPDPIHEIHPEHRRIGMLGEELLRAERQVIFYSTNMLAPYIHEVTQPAIKRNCLNTLYPTKRFLWEYENKYFLFEGYNQWIIKFNHE
jgi:hypothetical protein